jgi:hypothetical protein
LWLLAVVEAVALLPMVLVAVVERAAYLLEQHLLIQRSHIR